jgi:phosphatidylinositol dimannoside acyltransferase
VTAKQRGLDAPHRRAARGKPQADGPVGLRGRPGFWRVPARLLGRSVERVAVHAYAATTWVVAHVPSRLSRWVIGTGSQAGYLLWRTKRDWSNANFGHVAGLPPGDPRVRRLALGAYREYARYLVEVMHLETQSVEEAGSKVVQADLDHIEESWRDSKGGLIFTLGHVGNNEAVAAAVAGRGWPVNVVADDSTFPEMFERFRRLREAWGVHVIPWRNLREIYAVLRRREMLALLIDWGYRSDGIPVRLFGAWTTLPAGPATLAAKTGSRILPLSIRRTPEGLFHVAYAPLIDVESAAPADLQRATQAVADALAGTVGAAPEQWYSFKPMWPATPDEAAELERRAASMLADDRPRGGRARAADPIDYAAVPAEEVVKAAALLPESSEA